VAVVDKLNTHCDHFPDHLGWYDLAVQTIFKSIVLESPLTDR
jgi:hypothetical protein